MSRHLLISMLLTAMSYMAFGQGISKSADFSVADPLCFQNKLVGKLSESSSQQCFDQVMEQCLDQAMEQWFESFFLLQDEGYDMNQAHQIAYIELLTLNQSCDTSMSKVIDRSLLSLR